MVLARQSVERIEGWSDGLASERLLPRVRAQVLGGGSAATLW